MDKCINTYFRDKNGNKVGQAKAYKNLNGRIYVMYHFCDTRYDEYNKTHPFKYFDGDINTIPFLHRDKFLNHFIPRCLKYFKGCKFNYSKSDKVTKTKEKSLPKIDFIQENKTQVVFNFIIPKEYKNKQILFNVVGEG